MTAQLLVLAKVPVPGRVKTRLCPPCTPAQAAHLAAAALADTLDAVRVAGAARRTLALDQPPATEERDFTVIRQRGDGLAERIANAFSDTAAADTAPILQIGMDTPQAEPVLLDHCLAALADPDTDAVLGAAEDGGWWALGLRDPRHARLLSGVPMSTSDTGYLTELALKSAGLRVTALPALRDVDTFADALAVAAQVPTGRFAAAVRDR